MRWRDLQMTVASESSGLPDSVEVVVYATSAQLHSEQEWASAERAIAKLGTLKKGTKRGGYGLSAGIKRSTL